MQPIRTAGWFPPGFSGQREYGHGQDRGQRASRRQQADPPSRRRAGERDPRCRVGAADRRGLRAFHRRYRGRARPDQQAGALPPLEDPRRPAARHRPPPRCRRSACHSRHRHSPRRPSRAAHPAPTPPATPWLPWSAACSAATTTRPAPPRPSYATRFSSQRGSAVEQVVNRAVERGEVDPARLTPRIIDLPFDLFRNEMMMTLKPVPDHVLRQIVDDIFIPLVTPHARN